MVETTAVSKFHAALSPNYLWNPWIDFCSLGGGAIVVFSIITYLLPNGVRHQETLVMVLVLMINYPHFSHSYQLFYRGYRTKFPEYSPALRMRYIIAGFAIPLLLLGFFALAANSPQMLGYSANLMFFLVGWHYVKQGYDILILDAAKKGVFFDNSFKVMFRVNGYACWLAAWVIANQHAEVSSYLGLNYVTFEFPAWLNVAALALALMTTVATGVVFFKYWMPRQMLAWNGVFAYFAALYLWVLCIGNNPLIFALVPTFHSLQYEAVTWRYELSARGWRLAGFVAMGLLFGYLGFMGLPQLLDRIIDYDHNLFGSGMFVFLFAIFINVHHYFLDNVIWRRDNPEMRHLFTG